MKTADIIVYNAIKDYINTHGYSPSIRDLCEVTGKTSTSTIKTRLDSLVESGYIEIEPTYARTIRIIR